MGFMKNAAMSPNPLHVGLVQKSALKRLESSSCRLRLPAPRDPAGAWRARTSADARRHRASVS
eukprot:5773973-Prymnesium_polylepis.1